MDTSLSHSSCAGIYSMHIFSMQCYNSSLFLHIARLGLAQEIVHTSVNYNFKAYSSVSLSLSLNDYMYISLFSAGPKVKNISDLSEVNRFTEPPLTGPFCDLLWSDPLLEHVLGFQLSDQEFSEVTQFFLHDIP